MSYTAARSNGYRSRPATQMKLLCKQLSELVPAPYNPREISEAALRGLRESIHRYGLVEPIIWNERTGNVVGGHQRLLVLKADGVAETDVVVVDLPEVEEKALNVALNNPAIAGEFTQDVQAIIAELSRELPEVVEALRLGEIEAVAATPDFDELEAPSAALDRLGRVTCPECGHEFTP